MVRKTSRHSTAIGQCPTPFLRSFDVNGLAVFEQNFFGNARPLLVKNDGAHYWQHRRYHMVFGVWSASCGD